MTAKPKRREDMTDDERALLVTAHAEIQQGLDAANAGKLVDAEKVFDRLIAKYSEMAKNRA